MKNRYIPGDDSPTTHKRRLVAGEEGRRHGGICPRQLRQRGRPQGRTEGHQAAGQSPGEGQGQENCDEKGSCDEEEDSIISEKGALW